MILVVAVVSHLQLRLIAHGLNDSSEETLSRRNLLKQNLMLEVMALVDEIINSKRIDEPLSNATALQIFSIFDVVSASKFATTLNVNLKKILNSPYPIMESTLWNRVLVEFVEGAV